MPCMPTKMLLQLYSSSPMTNEIFQGSRFWAYFKYDLTQMWRNHVKAAVGLGLAGLIIYFVVVLFNLTFNGTWQGPGISGRFVTFFLASAALELYYTRIYGYLTDKRKGSAWLMLPASTVEKWVSMLIMLQIHRELGLHTSHRCPVLDNDACQPVQVFSCIGQRGRLSTAEQPAGTARVVVAVALLDGLIAAQTLFHTRSSCSRGSTLT